MKATNSAFYRRLARQMRFSIVVVLAGAVLITVVNLQEKATLPPWQFYIAMPVLCGFFWAFAMLLDANASRDE